MCCFSILAFLFCPGWYCGKKWTVWIWQWSPLCSSWRLPTTVKKNHGCTASMDMTSILSEQCGIVLRYTFHRAASLFWEQLVYILLPCLNVPFAIIIIWIFNLPEPAPEDKRRQHPEGGQWLYLGSWVDTSEKDIKVRKALAWKAP